MQAGNKFKISLTGREKKRQKKVKAVKKHFIIWADMLILVIQNDEVQ
jgi:hypothetical protein